MSDGLPTQPNAAPVDLAHTPEFSLGSARVRPATRELITPSSSANLEPRVMQVLVALARANGEVVTRDELTFACWEGRVVSDDAINRVISRLRGLSDGPTAGAFTIETIAKVGYRLVAGVTSASPAVAATSTSPEPAPASALMPARLPRRALIGVGAAALVLGGGGLLAWRLSQPAAPTETPVSTRARQLYDQGIRLGGADDPASDAQAIAFLREAVGQAPDFADAWAALACAYAGSRDTSPADSHPGLVASATEAANRSLAIDPGNADARGALALLSPVYGNWPKAENDYRAALALKPRHAPVHRALAQLLAGTGRLQEAITEAQAAVDQAPLTPAANFVLVSSLQYAGRVEEAERVSQHMVELWPLSTMTFFPRLYLYLYSSRPKRALELLTDEAARPRGIPASDFDLIILVARALQSGAVADRKAALDQNREAAHRGSGYALNAMLFASALGDLDMAFEIANAYYFGRPFTIAGADFSTEQGLYTQSRTRLTAHLFGPGSAAMRADPRFAELTREIGLTAYWRASGHKPDFCQTDAGSPACRLILPPT